MRGRLLVCLILVGVVFMVATAAALAAPVFAPVGGAPFATGDNPLSVAFSSDGSLLAVANANTHNVSVYSVGSGGGLTPVPGTGRAP